MDGTTFVRSVDRRVSAGTLMSVRLTPFIMPRTKKRIPHTPCVSCFQWYEENSSRERTFSKT